MTTERTIPMATASPVFAVLMAQARTPSAPYGVSTSMHLRAPSPPSSLPTGLAETRLNSKARPIDEVAHRAGPSRARAVRSTQHGSHAHTSHLRHVAGGNSRAAVRRARNIELRRPSRRPDLILPLTSLDDAASSCASVRFGSSRHIRRAIRQAKPTVRAAQPLPPGVPHVLPICSHPVPGSGRRPPRRPHGAIRKRGELGPHD
jgi:hypothetical protein